MKTLFITALMVLTPLHSEWVFSKIDRSGSEEIAGAWEVEQINGEQIDRRGVLLIADNYSFYTEFDTESKEFTGSQGGILTGTGGNYNYITEFNTWDNTLVGATVPLAIEVKGDRMTIDYGSGEEAVALVFSRIDDNKSELAGAWRITERMRNGEMSAMRTGPRKTIKMITGTRFQWAAFNTETGQFSGTGGGTITLKDGKYTEHIEFFSRNADRVGASLTFNYKVNGKQWNHSGMSSSGNPIHEIWTRQN